jgi:hypothetical protein
MVLTHDGMDLKKKITDYIESKNLDAEDIEYILRKLNYINISMLSGVFRKIRPTYTNSDLKDIPFLVEYLSNRENFKSQPEKRTVILSSETLFKKSKTSKDIEPIQIESKKSRYLGSGWTKHI